MPISIQYDVSGNIIGKVKYPASKPAPVMKEGMAQKIFDDDDEIVQALHTRKQKMNPGWDGVSSADAFVDRPKKDIEVLEAAYSMKNIVAIAADPVEWAKFETEIKKHKNIDGEVTKKKVV